MNSTISTPDPPMKSLFAVTAAIEAGAGVALVALPSLVSRLLLGSSLNGPAELTLARVAGVALFVLGTACWLARHDGHSSAATGLVGAMAIYNAAIATVLVYAGAALGLSGIGLWPVVLVHAVMTAWCVIRLLHTPRPSRNHPDH